MSAQNHIVSLQEAAKLTERYRQILMPLLGGIKGGYFNKEAIELVLNQEGVEGIRIYLGLSLIPLAIPQFVIVGVDALGNDVTTGVILDRSGLCPPGCPDPNELNS